MHFTAYCLLEHARGQFLLPLASPLPSEPRVELLQGLCEHLVIPRAQVSKRTSCNRVRRVQPSLPCAEGQQHLLSLPAPMALCQGTPKKPAPEHFISLGMDQSGRRIHAGLTLHVCDIPVLLLASPVPTATPPPGFLTFITAHGTALQSMPCLVEAHRRVGTWPFLSTQSCCTQMP